MNRHNSGNVRWLGALLLALLLPAAGRAGRPILGVPEADILNLERLANLASQHNPDLAAARARAEGARGRLLQAGLYPNPVLQAVLDELGHNGHGLGIPGLNVQQTIVTAHKLKLARAAEAQGVAAADWQAITRWYDVLTRVRLAYFEALTARRTVETNEKIVRLTQDALDAAEKLLKAGTGTKPDVLQAQVLRDQAKINLDIAKQRLAAALRLVAVAVGVRELPPAPLAGGLDDSPPKYDWQPVVEAVLARSSEVNEAQALVLQAERNVCRARAQAVPDVTVQVKPAYSFPDKDTWVEVQIGAPIPIFNRNQGNIHTAEADVARTSAELRSVELRLVERVTLAFQRYRTASDQVDAYEKRILPDARESLRLITFGYERGDPKYDYTALLQAQRILIGAELTAVQARGDLWRAVSELAGLLQLDDWKCGQ